MNSSIVLSHEPLRMEVWVLRETDMAESLKKQIDKCAVRATLVKFSTQVVSYVVGMVLARLLTQIDYRTVAPIGISPATQPLYALSF